MAIAPIKNIPITAITRRSPVVIIAIPPLHMNIETKKASKVLVILYHETIQTFLWIVWIRPQHPSNAPCIGPWFLAHHTTTMNKVKAPTRHSKPTETRLISSRYGSGPKPPSPRNIGANSLTLMTVGGIMGSGLFLAVGQAIRLAGPAIVISMLIGVTIMALEVMALSEMAVADRERGSFLAFAHHALGPGAAFVGGWIFWFSSILNISAEATAGAIFTRLWFPSIPVYVFSVGYAIIVVGINFLTVRGFSTVESWMSGTKITATVVFILLAAAALAGLLPVHTAAGVHGWYQKPSFFPHGVIGVFAAMVLVLFSMSGTGVLGLAAPNVKDADHTIAKSIRNTIIAIYVLYVGAALGLTGLLLWSTVPTAQSPFTAALRTLPWGWLVNFFNLVILLAVLSAMNAGLFATDRVLATLGRIHAAPHIVSRESHGIPRMANLVTGILFIIISGLAYFLPKTAYLYLVTATGFQALFIWGLIIVTQIVYHKVLLKEGKELPFRMKGYPYTSILAVALIVGVIATAPLAPHEMTALEISVGASVIFFLAYLPVRARRLHSSQRSQGK